MNLLISGKVDFKIKVLVDIKIFKMIKWSIHKEDQTNPKYVL